MHCQGFRSQSVQNMKLATIVTAVTLLTALSCLPYNLVACSRSRGAKEQAEPPVQREPTPDTPLQEWNGEQKKNILVLTLCASSGHIAVPLALAEELVRRGHNVTFSTSGNQTLETAQRLGITFTSSGPDSGIAKMVRESANKDSNKIREMLKSFPEMSSRLEQEITQFSNMIQTITEAGSKWDAVIATDFLMVILPCIATHLDIPAVLVGTTGQIYPHTYPPWPWPGMLVGGTSDDMTFLQRLGNGLERILIPYLLSFLFYSPAKPSIEKLCPDLTKPELLNAPAVYIPNIVPTAIGFEYARTMTPLTHYVGPILSKQPNSLSPELEEWLLNKEDKSVIYISMGSFLSVSKQTASVLVEGIQSTNYSVIWAMQNAEEFQLDVDPKRYYISKWLPQLAILRHRAVGLAILHCGANGVHESLHSGVPVIALPEVTEQKANAGRVHHHHLGIHLNRDGLTAEQVYQSILEIDSGDYRQNVAKIQKVFRQAGGVKRAADLVEFYSEVGYDHLIPAYAKYQWSWVQYYNVDVYSLLLLLALLIVYIDYRILKCICSRCCCPARKQKTD